jgi:hypothetical protein
MKVKTVIDVFGIVLFMVMIAGSVVYNQEYNQNILLFMGLLWNINALSADKL